MSARARAQRDNLHLDLMMSPKQPDRTPGNDTLTCTV